MVFENIKKDDLKRYRKKLLGIGVILSIASLSVMVLLFFSIYGYGEDSLIAEMMMYLVAIFALSLVASVIVVRLVEAKLSRCGCLEIGACRKNGCKYPWSSCLINAKFNYIICKNFIHDITEKIEEFV